MRKRQGKCGGIGITRGREIEGGGVGGGMRGVTKREEAKNEIIGKIKKQGWKKGKVVRG
jgi:hypothetical protein